MNNFKDFGIKPTEHGLTGDKIKMQRVFNKEITVTNYKIVPSKYQKKGDEKCLYLQFKMGDSEYIVFTGSIVLMETIERVPKGDFPFKTIIVNDNDRFEFT